MNTKIIITFFSLLIAISSKGQEVFKTVNPPENIKTISFNSNNSTSDPLRISASTIPSSSLGNIPLAKLGSILTISFDDLVEEEKKYYYKIKYYNSDWTPSSLFESEYITGFVSDEISEYNYSYNTIQSYVHYTLKLPNDLTTLTKSGNYAITIFEEDKEDKPLFSRRFMLYENKIIVGGIVKRSNRQLFEDQNVDIIINYTNFNIINPMEYIKLSVIQNNDWATLRGNIKPQFIRENQLLYKNMRALDFKGGNEFYYFESKDYQINTNYIAHVRQDEVGMYHHFLYTNHERKNSPYTYFPDINGNFKITSNTADDVSIEAEYIYVHFSLEKNELMADESIYVYGAFNDWALTNENRMKYNPTSKKYECTMLMKQGFYNYDYVTVSKNLINKTAISGSFHETENEYLLLVYYRKFGEQYDSLIGVGTAK